MFYLNRDVELSAALLQKMINKFHVEVEPKLNKRKHYYDGIQKILSKSYTDETKPCSRTVINYCKNIFTQRPYLLGGHDSIDNYIGVPAPEGV